MDQLSTEELLIKQEQGITTISLNRPAKRNALHGGLIRALLDAIKIIANDSTSRILMIRGAGEYFCAGADIDWMQKIALAPYEENRHDAAVLAELMYELYHFPKPTLVLAHGAAMGGGLGLLAVCDIALASHNTQFSFSEVKLGLAPSVISPYVLAAIGERQARYYFMTGVRFDAEEAQRIGLIHRLVAEKDLLIEGTKLADTLAQNSLDTLQEIKQLIRKVGGETISKDISHFTADHLARLRASAQGQEGLNAFIEKRKPHWP